jgi:hypothetical protein
MRLPSLKICLPAEFDQTPNNALQATAGVPARSMMKFISIPFFALEHRRHRLCLSLIR